MSGFRPYRIVVSSIQPLSCLVEYLTDQPIVFRWSIGVTAITLVTFGSLKAWFTVRPSRFRLFSIVELTTVFIHRVLTTELWEFCMARYLHWRLAPLLQLHLTE